MLLHPLRWLYEPLPSFYGAFERKLDKPDDE